MVSRMNIWSCQELPALKPACSSESILCYSKSFSSLSLIMVSSTLYHILSSEMGLCSEGLYDDGLVLGSSMTSACFMPIGTFLSSHIFYIRYTVMYSPVLPAPISNSAVIPSGPHAFFILSFLRLLTISSCVGIWHL